MAISIHWPTGVVTIPTADLTLVSPGKYELDLEWLRLQLRAAEASEDGAPWPKTHDRNAPATFGGTTYAQQLILLDPYTVTFENGSYRVKPVGANTNLGDKVNVNNVSLQIENSAGLIVVDSGGGGASAPTIAAAVWSHTKGAVLSALAENKCKLDRATGILTVYADDGTTVLRRLQLYSADNFTVPYDGTMPMHSREVAP